MDELTLYDWLRAMPVLLAMACLYVWLYVWLRRRYPYMGPRTKKVLRAVIDAAKYLLSFWQILIACAVFTGVVIVHLEFDVPAWIEKIEAILVSLVLPLMLVVAVIEDVIHKAERPHRRD